MKHLFSILLLCSFLTLRVAAQNYKQEFEKLCETGDTIKQAALLAKWEKAKPGDAELYIAYFNYYVSKSKTEVITQVDHPAAAKSKTAKKQTGYTSEIGYLPEPLAKGFKYINTGISKNPTRLDMRFGKIYMLGETFMYTALTKEIVSMVDYSATIHCKWKWTDNKPLEKPETFMLSAVQEYVAQIYNAGKSQATNITEISLAVLKYYPKHVESLSDLGIAYTMKGDLNSALKYFLKATNIEPKDFIVLNNIANIYDKKNDTANAIKYYELTLKYGDKEAKDQANNELKRLKVNKPATAKTNKTGTTTTATKTGTKTAATKSSSKTKTTATTTKKAPKKKPS